MANNTIGAKIRQKRTELGLLQKQLAVLVGIDPALMSLIERGYRKPAESLIPKLSQVLQVSPEWLLYGGDEKLPDEKQPDELHTDEFRRDKLASLIAYLGMTKTRFAETINISRITLGKYVNGSVPMKYKIVNRAHKGRFSVHIEASHQYRASKSADLEKVTGERGCKHPIAPVTCFTTYQR